MLCTLLCVCVNVLFVVVVGYYALLTTENNRAYAVQFRYGISLIVQRLCDDPVQVSHTCVPQRGPTLRRAIEKDVLKWLVNCVFVWCIFVCPVRVLCLIRDF